MRALRLHRLGLTVAAACALLGTSCFNKNWTGFIITVDRPDPSIKAPGVDYNELVVDVTASDGSEQSVTQQITSLTPAPYVVLVTFGPKSSNITEVQSIAVSLNLNQTVIAAYNLPAQPVVQHELTPLTVNLTAQ